MSAFLNNMREQWAANATYHPATKGFTQNPAYVTFQKWLDEKPTGGAIPFPQIPRKIAIHLQSSLEHHTNKMKTIAAIDWTPELGEGAEFRIHALFPHLRRSSVELQGDIRGLTPTLVNTWQNQVAYHISYRWAYFNGPGSKPATTIQEKLRLQSAISNLLSYIRSHNPETDATWQRWYTAHVGQPVPKESYKKGFTLMVHLQRVNSNYRFSLAIDIDEHTTETELLEFKDSIDAILHDKSSQFGVDPRYQSIEQFRAWVENAPFLTINERLSTTFIAASSTQRARINVTVNTTDGPETILEIRVTNDDITPLVIKEWEDDVSTAVHRFLKARETEYQPPRKNKHLRDNEDSETEDENCSLVIDESRMRTSTPNDERMPPISLETPTTDLPIDQTPSAQQSGPTNSEALTIKDLLDKPLIPFKVRVQFDELKLIRDEEIIVNGVVMTPIRGLTQNKSVHRSAVNINGVMYKRDERNYIVNKHITVNGDRLERPSGLVQEKDALVINNELYLRPLGMQRIRTLEIPDYFPKRQHTINYKPFHPIPEELTPILPKGEQTGDKRPQPFTPAPMDLSLPKRPRLETTSGAADQHQAPRTSAAAIKDGEIRPPRRPLTPPTECPQNEVQTPSHIAHFYTKKQLAARLEKQVTFQDEENFESPPRSKDQRPPSPVPTKQAKEEAKALHRIIFKRPLPASKKLSVDKVITESSTPDQPTVNQEIREPIKIRFKRRGMTTRGHPIFSADESEPSQKRSSPTDQSEINVENSSDQTAFFKAMEERTEKSAFVKAPARPNRYPKDCIHNYDHIDDAETREFFRAEDERRYEENTTSKMQNDSDTESERNFNMNAAVADRLDENNQFDLQEAKKEHLADWSVKGDNAHTLLCIRRKNAESRLIRLNGYEHELRKSAKRQVDATLAHLDEEKKTNEAKKIRIELDNYITKEIQNHFQDDTEMEIKIKSCIGRLLRRNSSEPEEAKILALALITNRHTIKEYQTRREEDERVRLISYRLALASQTATKKEEVELSSYIDDALIPAHKGDRPMEIYLKEMISNAIHRSNLTAPQIRKFTNDLVSRTTSDSGPTITKDKDELRQDSDMEISDTDDSPPITEANKEASRLNGNLLTMAINETGVDYTGLAQTINDNVPTDSQENDYTTTLRENAHHFLTVDAINKKAAENRERRLRIFRIVLDRAAKAIAANTDKNEASIKDQIEAKLDLAITTFYGQNQEMQIRYRTHIARMVQQNIIAPEDLITYIDERIIKRSPYEWKDNTSIYHRPKTTLYLSDDEIKRGDKYKLTELLDRYQAMLLLIAQDENERARRKEQEAIGIEAERVKLESQLNKILETIHEGHLRLELQLKEKLSLKFAGKITSKIDIIDYAEELSRRAKEGLPLFKSTANKRNRKSSTKGTTTMRQDNTSEDAGQTDVKTDFKVEPEPRSDPTPITNCDNAPNGNERDVNKVRVRLETLV